MVTPGPPGEAPEAAPSEPEASRAMSISLVTPLGALVALGGLVPLAVLVVGRQRLQALCALLGLRPPSERTTVPTHVAVVALVALLGLAAAQPVAARRTTTNGRADAEAFFVFDVSRSMGARMPGSPSRLDRAKGDAKRLRAALPGLPVGIASLTDRLLPHLFPSVSLNTFNATLDGSLGIDRPTSSFPYGNINATKLGTLGACGQDNVALSFTPDDKLYVADFKGQFCSIDYTASPPVVTLVAKLSANMAVSGDLVARRATDKVH